MFSYCFLLTLALATAANAANTADPLYTVLNDSTEGIPDCSSPLIVSCKKIELDVDLIESQKKIYIPETGLIYTRKGNPKDEDGTEIRILKKGQDEVIITLEKEEDVYTIKFSSGK